MTWFFMGSLLQVEIEAHVTPNVLECADQPQWAAFRDQVAEALETQSWIPGRRDNHELAYAASTLSDSVMQRIDLLKFDFIRDLHLHCKDSNNFERYFIRSHFSNYNLSFVPLEDDANRGFCLYGVFTALVVVFFHSDVHHTRLRYLLMAWNLLGRYFALDYLENTSWPISSYFVLRAWESYALRGRPLEKIAFESDIFQRHVGETGPETYHTRLKWDNTLEHQKKLGWIKGTVRIWQFCIHSATAGEAVTMLPKAAPEVVIEWDAHSASSKLCYNYSPNLCPTSEEWPWYYWLADRIEANDMPFSEVVDTFRAKVMPALELADVWMCSIPAIYCQLLMELAYGNKVIFAYFGLPILQHVPKDMRELFLENIIRLVNNPQHVVAANNVYLAEQIAWQTNYEIRIPVIRILGLHTNATYMPPGHTTEVLVSRPGSSGAWQECLLRRFIENTPDYPFSFVQFTDLLDPEGSVRHSETYNRTLDYQTLSQFRAVVEFPYDTSLMFFWEFYSMGMPTFVPRPLWRWSIYGQHTRPDLAHPRKKEDAGQNTLSLESGDGPFFDAWSPPDVTRALFWSQYTDWAMFPHVQYFQSLSDLLDMIQDTKNLRETSQRMAQFNEESLSKSKLVWRRVVGRFMAART